MTLEAGWTDRNKKEIDIWPEMSNAGAGEMIPKFGILKTRKQQGPTVKPVLFS